MTIHTNILAFPAAHVLPVGRHDRCDPVDEAPRLRRPRLLITAARHGQRAYRRSRDLRRLMQGADDLPAPGKALGWLREREARMDEARRNGRINWELQTHILLLIALMAETRLAREAGIGADGAAATIRRAKPPEGQLIRLSAG